MIYIIQILNMLNLKEKEVFLNLFNDLDFEINELGYKGNESDLINDMLESHFWNFYRK